jgi:NADPH2:quinone reductase
MRAAFYEKNGSAADVLTVDEVDTPRPGRGEVRVRLATSGVNPSDVKARAGRTRKIAFPRVIPHSDGAGEIDLVGEGVPTTRVGERVWVYNAQWKRAYGTSAEYVALPSELVVTLPDHISFEAGACLGIPAMTAVHAVAVAGAAPGTTLMISGGAGAVAHYAIQFAKARGAHVITTISSQDKAELARAAGADHTIDYKNEDVGEKAMQLTHGRGVDAVIELDFAANARLLPGVLRQHGKVVIYGTGQQSSEIPTQWLLVNSITLQFIFVYELSRSEREAALSTISGMLGENRLIHNIAKTLPLGDVVSAHEAVESGDVRGNVVLRTG